jgi:hypothetical protein
METPPEEIRKREEEEKREKKKGQRKAKRSPEIMDFVKQRQNWIMTTRFNTQTWEENEAFRHKYPKIGCIYPALEPISSTIPQDNIIFVLEMNNDKNQIMGIGMMKNKSVCNPTKYKVYSEHNYNRYTYMGKRRIDRSEMVEEEETVMKLFDILCFKGAKHMKRLRGIKMFPPEILFRCKSEIDLVDFVMKMFERRKSTTHPI